ncbi:MAG TPA: DUF4388 domain-containing protein [Planctomycetota bacterium]|nr:DUF4388 domain-containing protein [Planctomycetota bacterium]
MNIEGDLELLHLSDLLQALAQRQHSGTLRVFDGRREKVVHFVRGEVALLASERRLRLGELLVADGVISESDAAIDVNGKPAARMRTR